MSNQSAIRNPQSEMRALAALSAVAAAVSQSLDLRETLTAALDATLEATGFEVGGIVLWNEKEQRLEQLVTQGVEPQLLDAFLGPLHANGNQERLLHTGLPVFHDDTTYDPTVNPEIARAGFTIAGMVPLVHQGRVLGLLAVATRAPRQWTEEDKSLLTAVGRQIAVAVASAQLHKRTRQSEEKYRSLVNTTADLIFTVDVEGTILFANPAAKAFTGYEPDETIGHHFSEYVHPEDVPILQAGIQQALSGEPLESIRGIGQPAEYRMRKRDGQIIWVQHRSWPLRDAEGNIVGFSGITRDITARKRVEEALRESEERFRSIVEQSADGIAVTDEQGRITVWNRSLEQMTGLSAQEMVGKPIWDTQFQMLLPEERTPERYEQLRSGLQAFLNTGHAPWAGQVMEREYPRPDGTRRFLQGVVFAIKTEKGFMLGSIIRDVTGLRRTERALEQVNERLRILREVDRGILTARSLEEIAHAALSRIQRLVPCQRASVALFDLESQEALALAVHASGETRLGAGQRMPLTTFGLTEELMQGESHVVTDLRRWPKKDPIHQAMLKEGTHSFVNIPLIDRGELIGTLNLGAEEVDGFTNEHVEVAREVADSLAIAIQQARLQEELRKHAEELELRVAERTEELQRANEELEAFAYSVSHDLRAPLRAMEGFAQALLEDYADRFDEMGREYARRIVAAAQRMDVLINDLLLYSRLGHPEIRLKPVNLEPIIERALAQLEPEIQNRHAEIQVTRPLPAVMGHSLILEQILVNLLSNAIKFVAPGARPQAHVWAEESEERVRLWVEDNGIGIPREHHERIFRVFERLHGIEAYPGTGIGLAIVRKGVERLGGQCGVESEVGKGSRFWVDIPPPEPEATPSLRL